MRTLAAAAGLAVVVAIVSWSMAAITRATFDVAPVWPTNAIVLVAMLRVRRLPPVIALAVAYAVQLLLGIDLFAFGFRSAAMPLCNMVEVAVIYRALRDMGGGPLDLGLPRHLLRFLAVGVIAGPALSATLATTIISVDLGQLAAAAWPAWYLTDALGILIFVPLLTSFTGNEAAELARAGQRLRASAVMLTVAAVTLLVFAQSELPLLFVAFPLLVLAAFTLGSQGVPLASFIVVVISFVATGLGHGPLSLVPPVLGENARLLVLQGFWAAVMLVTVPVSTILAEQQRLARSLTATKQQQLDDALRSMPDAFSLFGVDNRLQLLNDRARDLFATIVDVHVPGAHIGDIVEAAAARGIYAKSAVLDAARGKERLAEILAGSRQEVELADGRWIETVSQRTREGRLIVLNRDITVRRRMEQVLEHRRKGLELANAELDQFASMAAHDLRAPLRQIGIACDWLIQDLGHDASGTVSKRLQQIRQRVQRMSKLVDGLRAYAQAGPSGMPARELELRPILDDAIELAGGAEFTFDVQENLPTLHGPEPAVALVFRNLVGNAVKHHDRADGHIRISAIERLGEIEIILEDDGPGLPERERARAFDLLDRITGDAGAPGGMGLSMVRRTMTVHGGRVWLGTSSLGRGTAIHVVWPRLDKAAQAA